MTVLLLTCCTALSAQNRWAELADSMHYRAALQTSLASGAHTPLWLNANKYGLSSLKNVNGYVRGAIERPLSADRQRRWGLGYGVDMAVAANYTSTFVVQQAYVEGRWLKGVMTIGAKEQPLELKNQELSSGSQTLGINARPVPQVRVALPDYWTIPGTGRWLAIKGHVAYGVTTDDQWQQSFRGTNKRYTEHTLYHSKAGYLRIGPRNITLEAGIEMACQFGGTSHRFIDGEEKVYDISSNAKAFWHALVPGGSDVTDGQYKNFEGNQVGSLVARLNLDYEQWALGLYADHFFEDNSSMVHLSRTGYGTGDDWQHKTGHKYFLYDFKDFLLGAELQLKQTPWLSSIVLEHLYTKYQAGPVYHDHTVLVGEHLTGRDNFYNHHLFTGWQHWGQVMGNPLYLSPLYNADGSIEVKNNRFTAWHLGLSGDPLPQLHYRVLATLQHAYGSYYSLYPDPYHTISLMGEAHYRFADHSKLKGWSVKAAIGLDSGKVYGNNFGVQLTIVKRGMLNL